MSYEIGAHVRRPIILQMFTDGRKLKVEQSDRPCIFQGHNSIRRVIARRTIEVRRSAQKERHVRGGGKELGGEAVGTGWWRGGEEKHQSLIPFLESKTRRLCSGSAESKAENQREGKEARGHESKAEGVWRGNNYLLQQHQQKEPALPPEDGNAAHYILQCEQLLFETQTRALCIVFL